MSHSSLSRRAVLGAGLLALSGAGVAALGRPAAAQTVQIGEYHVAVPTEPFTTKSGRLASLVVATEYDFQWAGLSAGASHADVTLSASLGGPEVIVATDQVTGLSGSAGELEGTRSLPDVDLVSTFGAAAFEDVTELDGPVETPVTLRLAVVLTTTDGETYTTDSAQPVTIAVENVPTPVTYENDLLSLTVVGDTATLRLPEGAFAHEDDDGKHSHVELLFGGDEGDWAVRVRYATTDSSAPTMRGYSYRMDDGPWTRGVPTGYSAELVDDSFVVTFPDSVGSVGAAYTDTDTHGKSTATYLSKRGSTPWSTRNLLPL